MGWGAVGREVKVRNVRRIRMEKVNEKIVLGFSARVVPFFLLLRCMHYGTGFDDGRSLTKK
jgi:hypothetical protein